MNLMRMLIYLGLIQYQVNTQSSLNLSMICDLYSEFYFNFKSSILGSLVPSLSSHSCHLTHIFIATLLLPCGELNGQIKKFTGNEKFGDPENHLTKAIHAFSHFTAVYTQQSIIFCDLQGEICLVPNF
jgi:Alpha-kinase family